MDNYYKSYGLNESVYQKQIENNERFDFWQRQTLRDKAAHILVDWGKERKAKDREIESLKEENKKLKKESLNTFEEWLETVEGPMTNREIYLAGEAFYAQQEKINKLQSKLEGYTVEAFYAQQEEINKLQSKLEGCTMNSPEAESTVYTVQIAVSQDWIRDGFDLTDKVTQERLKDAILSEMLGFARDREVSVNTIKKEDSNFPAHKHG